MERLARFRDLARELRRAARSGNMTALGPILAERRSLLESFPDSLPAGPDEARARRRVLEEILDLDRESEWILRERREALRAELVSLDGGRRGLEGYRPGRRPAAKWIDERG